MQCPSYPFVRSICRMCKSAVRYVGETKVTNDCRKLFFFSQFYPMKMMIWIALRRTLWNEVRMFLHAVYNKFEKWFIMTMTLGWWLCWILILPHVRKFRDSMHKRRRVDTPYWSLFSSLSHFFILFLILFRFYFYSYLLEKGNENERNIWIPCNLPSNSLTSHQSTNCNCDLWIPSEGARPKRVVCDAWYHHICFAPRKKGNDLSVVSKSEK